MRPDCGRTYYRPAVIMDESEVRAVSAIIYRHGKLSNFNLPAADIIGFDANHNRHFRSFGTERDVAAALDSSAVFTIVLSAFAD